jgi:hypothetical protein
VPLSRLHTLLRFLGCAVACCVLGQLLIAVYKSLKHKATVQKTQSSTFNQRLPAYCTPHTPGTDSNGTP